MSSRANPPFRLGPKDRAAELVDLAGNDKQTMKLDGCAAVITGASAGIGRELARQLAGRAKLLVLVARRRNRLKKLRSELLRVNEALRVEIREVDLSNLEQTVQVAGWLANEPIDFLVNNAGLGDHGSFTTADPARVNEQIQVNALALTALTRAVLPRMIAQKRGAITASQAIQRVATFIPGDSFRLAGQREVALSPFYRKMLILARELKEEAGRGGSPNVMARVERSNGCQIGLVVFRWSCLALVHQRGMSCEEHPL